MIKGVLFDFDGTLTLPGALDFPAIKRSMGCPPDQPILEFLDTLPCARRGELLKILEQEEEVAATASRPNEGAEKCISSLKKRGVRIGILTRNSLASVKTALRRFRDTSLEDFDTVITREVSRPKPHPDGVLEAARRMGLPSANILVVGDFRFDVMAGNVAGAKTALLNNGARSVMAPGDPEPDFVINHLNEIVSVLDSQK